MLKLVTFLLLVCLTSGAVLAQDGVIRQQRLPSDWNWVDNSPAGRLKAKQLIEQADASLGMAVTEIRKALPVYGGHAN